MRYRIGAALAALLVTMPAAPWHQAWAQLPPSGQPVLNQAVSAAAITPSDSTIFKQTRGLHVGDAAACAVKVMFANDSVAVVLSNLQPGGVYPYSIIRLYATGGTTCAAVAALR